MRFIFLLVVLAILLPQSASATPTGDCFGCGGSTGSVTGLTNPLVANLNGGGFDMTNIDEISASEFNSTASDGNRFIELGPNTDFDCSTNAPDANGLGIAQQGGVPIACLNGGTERPFRQWISAGSDSGTAQTDLSVTIDNWTDSYAEVRLEIRDVFPTTSCNVLRVQVLQNTSTATACGATLIHEGEDGASTPTQNERLGSNCRLNRAFAVNTVDGEGITGSVLFTNIGGDDMLADGEWYYDDEGAGALIDGRFTSSLIGTTPTNGWDGFVVNCANGATLNGEIEAYVR